MTPDPAALHPIDGIDTVVFLRPLLDSDPVPGVDVGDFTYYSDFDDPTAFFRRNVRYNFGLSGAHLSIGRYCAIAHGASFLMADANHALCGPSTYPFPVFGGAWAERLPVADTPFENKGDIVVGNDVWIGDGATVLAGARIGDGAVIGARAVVAGDIPDYTVSVGNPARVKRRRYGDAEIARLKALAWWDWPAEAVARAVPHLVTGSLDDLDAFARSEGLTPEA
jgi:virginiamycin A acetyltransferase